MNRHYKLAFEAMNNSLRDQFALRGLLRAWLESGRAHPSVEEAGRAAAIGYCYGGMVMFDIVRSGIDIDVVVSFHVRVTKNKSYNESVIPYGHLHGEKLKTADSSHIRGFVHVTVLNQTN